MRDFDRLELSTETLRELTGEELAGVAGGGCSQQPTPPIYAITYGLCPSGATWFTDCDTRVCEG